MSEKAKGIGLFGLIGMVVSSCIGSGVFAITGQLAGVASPGAVLVAWAVVGIGFAALEEQIGSLERHRVGLIRRGYCVFRDLRDPQHIRIRKSRSGDLDNVFGAGIMVFVVDTA